MAFTKDYLLMPWVIFTERDSSIGSIENLMHKTVSVERNYVMHKKLVVGYPDIELLVKKTSQEAIEAGVKAVLDDAPADRGHVFNLGHGILPHTPPANAAFLVDTVKRLSRRQPAAGEA